MQLGTEDDVNNSARDGDFLHELELRVTAELNLVKLSHPEEITGPSTEWRFDPVDVQRAEIGLRSLLGAIEAVEGSGEHTARN